MIIIWVVIVFDLNIDLDLILLMIDDAKNEQLIGQFICMVALKGVLYLNLQNLDETFQGYELLVIDPARSITCHCSFLPIDFPILKRID
jgi:hypothetical protein